MKEVSLLENNKAKLHLASLNLSNPVDGTHKAFHSSVS